MNLRDLKYLVAVAEHRHFGRAAEACFVSQPTLSTQLKKLEETLGVTLIERSNRQVMLAAEGEKKLPNIVTNSQSTPILSRSAHYFSDLAPKEYREQLISNLSYSPQIDSNRNSRLGQKPNNNINKDDGNISSMKSTR